MTLREFINELQSRIDSGILDAGMPVCGESETSVWVIDPDELRGTRDVPLQPEGTHWKEVRPVLTRVLILGYTGDRRE